MRCPAPTGMSGDTARGPERLSARGQQSISRARGRNHSSVHSYRQDGPLDRQEVAKILLDSYN